jgi:hypothetical protein
MTCGWGLVSSDFFFFFFLRANFLILSFFFFFVLFQTRLSFPLHSGKEVPEGSIVVKLQFSGRTSREFVIALTEPFSALAARIGDLQSVPAAAVTLKFDGDRVEPTQTPGDLDMEDDDVLDVIVAAGAASTQSEPAAVAVTAVAAVVATAAVAAPGQLPGTPDLQQTVRPRRKKNSKSNNGANQTGGSQGASSHGTSSQGASSQGASSQSGNTDRGAPILVTVAPGPQLNAFATFGAKILSGDPLKKLSRALKALAPGLTSFSLRLGSAQGRALDPKQSSRAQGVVDGSTIYILGG